MKNNFFTNSRAVTMYISQLLMILLMGSGVVCTGQKPIPTMKDSTENQTDSIFSLPKRTTENLYKEKPVIDMPDSYNNIIESRTADGSIIYNWANVLNMRHQWAVLSDGGEKMWGDEKNNYSFCFRYKVSRNYEQLQKKFSSLGFEIPIEKFKKAALIHYRYSYGWRGSFLFKQFIVEMYDASQATDTAIWGGEFDAYYTISQIDVYNYKGELIAKIEDDKMPLSPNYVFIVSDDGMYVLIGTTYPIAEDYVRHNEFLLYDIKQKKSIIVPGVDDDKYGELDVLLDDYYYDSGLFQFVYRNNLQGLRFMVDVHKRLLYSRYYPAPTMEEEYNKSGWLFLPDFQNGELSNKKYYDIIPY